MNIKINCVSIYKLSKGPCVPDIETLKCASSLIVEFSTSVPCRSKVEPVTVLPISCWQNFLNIVSQICISQYLLRHLLF